MVERCRQADGRLTVTVGSADALRCAIKRIGHSVFPGGPEITPMVFRSQKAADMKATFGAGSEVAAAMGHCSDRSQHRYGNVRHGVAAELSEWRSNGRHVWVRFRAPGLWHEIVSSVHLPCTGPDFDTSGGP